MDGTCDPANDVLGTAVAGPNETLPIEDGTNDFPEPCAVGTRVLEPLLLTVGTRVPLPPGKRVGAPVPLTPFIGALALGDGVKLAFARHVVDVPNVLHLNEQELPGPEKQADPGSSFAILKPASGQMPLLFKF
jgi:hypothetical protein